MSQIRELPVFQELKIINGISLPVQVSLFFHNIINIESMEQNNQFAMKNYKSKRFLFDPCEISGIAFAMIFIEQGFPNNKDQLV